MMDGRKESDAHAASKPTVIIELSGEEFVTASPLMAPKTKGKKVGGGTGTSTPAEPAAGQATPVQSFAESLSYLNYPRPFKNPAYSKGAARRTRNLKTVLTQERERERQERERKRAEREEAANAEKMEVDGEATEAKTSSPIDEEETPTYISVEAPPSFQPQKHYCDITGLEAPYTDPATGLRYHDKSVYAFIKTLNASAVKEYLSLRGVNPIVK